LTNEIKLLQSSSSVKSRPVALICGGFIFFTGFLFLVLLIFPAKISLLIIALGAGLIGVPVLRATHAEYTVTNLRVVTRAGVFVHVQKEIPIADLRDAAVLRTGLQEILGVGDVVLHGSAGDFVIEGVDEPEKLRDKILSLK